MPGLVDFFLFGMSSPKNMRHELGTKFSKRLTHNAGKLPGAVWQLARHGAFVARIARICSCECKLRETTRRLYEASSAPVADDASCSAMRSSQSSMG